jgi:hypothetical protein
MPYHWVRIGSSPPRKRREQVHDICRAYGARLCERQIYYDAAQGQAYALIDVRDGKDISGLISKLQEELLDEDRQSMALVDADEQDAFGAETEESEEG